MFAYVREGVPVTLRFHVADGSRLTKSSDSPVMVRSPPTVRVDPAKLRGSTWPLVPSTKASVTVRFLPLKSTTPDVTVKSSLTVTLPLRMCFSVPLLITRLL